MHAGIVVVNGSDSPGGMGAMAPMERSGTDVRIVTSASKVAWVVAPYLGQLLRVLVNNLWGLGVSK